MQADAQMNFIALLRRDLDDVVGPVRFGQRDQRSISRIDDVDLTVQLIIEGGEVDVEGMMQPGKITFLLADTGCPLRGQRLFLDHRGVTGGIDDVAEGSIGGNRRGYDFDWLGCAT
jgi:hypothetical protein